MKTGGDITLIATKLSKSGWGMNSIVKTKKCILTTIET